MGQKRSDGGFRYVWSRNFIRLALQLYFRSIEVYGKNFFPRRGRTLVIANHQTGLVDGILIIGTNQVVIRTMIKHTLWLNPIIGFFADCMGMIPVQRKQDLGADQLNASAADRHKGLFGRVEQTFLDNESALIFPEGVSHDNPHILKLRSGAARMLLQTEAKHDFRLGIRWIPISLDFEGKDRPRTRVLIHYHPSRGIESYQDLYRRDPEAAVAALRQEMDEYLSDITVNFRTWEDRLFLERLTEFWLSSAPAGLLLDRHNQLLKWKRVLESTQNDSADEWSILRKKVNDLYTSLEGMALRPREIFRRSHEGKRLLLTRILPKFLILSPGIIFGTFLWYLPTWAIQKVTIKGAANHRDIVATYHIIAALVIYPAWLLLLLSIMFAFSNSVEMLGFIIAAVCAGLMSLLVPRRLRLEARAALNIHRYAKLEKVMAGAGEQIHEIWRLSARLWNSGLRRQVIIESPSTPVEAVTPPAPAAIVVN